MSPRQIGDRAPGDSTRWRDGLAAAGALLGFAALADAIAHWDRWPAVLLAVLIGGCTAADWRTVGDVLDALDPPAKPGRPPGTIVNPGHGAWVRHPDGSTVRLAWPDYCERYADPECSA